MKLTIEETLKQAVAFGEEGKLQDAERLYGDILQSQSTHPDANHNLGVLAVSRNKIDAALPLFKKALKANPKKEQFWFSYISALIKDKNFEAAKQVIEQVKSKGMAVAKLQIFEEQLQSNLSPSSDNPQQEFGNQLQSHQDELSPAIELREAGKYKEAQEWLSDVIAHDSRNAKALSLLAQVLLLDKKDAEAERMLTAAASINSKLPSVYRNQARLLLKQSKTKEALAKAQLGYKQSPEDSESLLVLAACLGANQRDLEALSIIEKILKAKSNHAEAYANRALIKLRAKDAAGAIEDAKMAVSLKPHLTLMWSLLGSLHYQANNLSDAVEALRRAHKNEPENPAFMIQLGEFLRQDNKASEAITILKQATELAPKNADAWTNLGIALQEEKRIVDAKIVYKKALALNSKSVAVSSNLGALAIEAEEWESALRYFGKALEIEPNLAEVHYNLGITLNELGRLDEAEASYNRAMALKPNYAEAHNNLGNTLRELGRFEEAEASYKKAIVLKPDFATAHYNLGNILLKEIRKLEEAEASYSQAIALKPDYAEASTNLGITLNELGRLDEAEASYNRAIASKPDSAEPHNNLGDTLRELGRFDEAKASYKKALVLKPDFAEAHHNLGDLLKEIGKLEEAEASYSQAIALKPENFKVHNELLVCRYLLDKKSIFFDQLDHMIKHDIANAVTGSLTCRGALKYGLEKPNLFCSKPLEYVLHTDLSTRYDFEKIFVGTTKSILNENRISNRKQNLLMNGYQTSGNLFDIQNDSINEIQKAIRVEIEKYRINFKNSEEGLIKKWPTEYSLYGWLISMKSGGELKPHIHSLGWLSGSIYINIPPKSEANSGNLVVSVAEERDATDARINLKNIVNVVTGSLVLFPASLSHHTIPFESEEERIVLAFDVRQK